MTASNALGTQSAQDQQVTPAVRAQMADPAAWAVTAFATTSWVVLVFAVLAWYHAARPGTSDRSRVRLPLLT